MATAGRGLNGIDVDGLRSTVSLLKEQPELGMFRFRARNKWIGGTHNRASVKDFYGAGREDDSRTEPMLYDEDEPPVLLGTNDGANPVEFVLVGLSGCLTTTMIAHAAARDIELKSVESELEGDLDVRGLLGITEDVRNGYQNIRVKFRIESDAPDEKLRELVELAQKRSPVFDVVTHQVPVSVTFERK